MSEPKFTPGPWKFSTNSVWTIYPANYPDEGSLMCNMTYYPWVPENKADWHLIAAAPELYEALEDMHKTQLNNNKHDPDDYENTEQCLRVKAALAKARGEG